MIDAVYPTDLLRVAVAVPLFGYAAYRDVLERRVRHHVWLPGVVVAVAALAADLVIRDPEFVVRFAALSLAVGAVFGYGFYYLGTFGGADRYALVVIALLFPVYPLFNVAGQPLPVVVPDAPIFVLTVLANTVVVGIFYPLKLTVENLRRRNLESVLLVFLGKKVAVDDLDSHYGRLLLGPENSDEEGPFSVLRSPEGVRDVDLVHDLLDWHDVDRPSEIEDPRLEEFVEKSDRWSSTDIERDQRELEELMERDTVWISPGIPFVVPMLAGLAVALTYGDLLFAFLDAFFV